MVMMMMILLYELFPLCWSLSKHFSTPCILVYHE